MELQKLADESGLTLRVLHYPPGTSKWNRIEHRMFCHITQNWRGQPLESRIAVVELIGATTTKTGLTIECALDERTYEKGIRIKKSEMKRLDIEGDAFHPEWNYAIKPRRSTRSGYRCGCPERVKRRRAAARTQSLPLVRAMRPGKLRALSRQLAQCCPPAIDTKCGPISTWIWSMSA